VKSSAFAALDKQVVATLLRVRDAAVLTGFAAELRAVLEGGTRTSHLSPQVLAECETQGLDVDAMQAKGQALVYSALPGTRYLLSAAGVWRAYTRAEVSPPAVVFDERFAALMGSGLQSEAGYYAEQHPLLAGAQACVAFEAAGDRASCMRVLASASDPTILAFFRDMGDHGLSRVDEWQLTRAFWSSRRPLKSDLVSTLRPPVQFPTPVPGPHPNSITHQVSASAADVSVLCDMLKRGICAVSSEDPLSDSDKQECAACVLSILQMIHSTSECVVVCMD
jgi:hypothetical protein